MDTLDLNPGPSSGCDTATPCAHKTCGVCTNLHLHKTMSRNFKCSDYGCNGSWRPRRLIRLLRLARMGRLMQFFPELLTLVKGMVGCLHVCILTPLQNRTNQTTIQQYS
eukprot:1123268-Amphidinium_carterae.1